MRSLVRFTGSMRQGCAGGFDSQQVIQVRSRPHGRPPDALGGRRLILALGLTAFPPIARFSGVVSNGNDYSFFWQFNGDYIVWEAFQNQASCTGIAGFFGER